MKMFSKAHEVFKLCDVEAEAWHEDTGLRGRADVGLGLGSVLFPAYDLKGASDCSHVKRDITYKTRSPLLAPVKGPQNGVGLHS